MVLAPHNKICSPIISYGLFQHLFDFPLLVLPGLQFGEMWWNQLEYVRILRVTTSTLTHASPSAFVDLKGVFK